MSSSTNIQTMQNPSIVLYGAKNAKLEDKPLPKDLDPHDVLVRIAYVGVCGSNVCLPLLTSHQLPNNHLRSISGTTAG
jgi:threonine dehydrogenase-like Zn-dependent dehydrogenase